MEQRGKMDLMDVGYVKLVTVGSVNPNHPLSDQSRQQQVALLNRCLHEYPKGVIIGKDTTIGRYLIGAHELTMEQTTYHVGFARRPGWDMTSKEELL